MTEVSFPKLGIHFNVNSVAFKLFGIDVYWYGVIIAVGILLCVTLAMKHCKNNRFSTDLVADTILVALPAAIVGARLYYVICEWDSYKGDLKSIFDTRSGGLAVYGGIIGALIAIFVMCKIRKIPFSAILDFGIPYLPLGQAIGRWGNFFNQEAFGTTTDLPWGMTSDKIQTYLRVYCKDLDSTMPVHPTFLYESLVNLALFFVLLFVRKKSKHNYEATCVYLVVYGFARFFIEGLRTDSLYIGNTAIRTSQLLSFILMVVGLVYIFYANVKNVERTYIPEKFLVPKEDEKDKNKTVKIIKPSGEVEVISEGTEEENKEETEGSSAEPEDEEEVHLMGEITVEDVLGESEEELSEQKKEETEE